MNQPSLIDCRNEAAGQICVTDATVLFDQHPVVALSCSPDVIAFQLQGQDEAQTCPPEAFWEACAGPGVAPTARDSGYLLALSLAERLAAERWRAGYAAVQCQREQHRARNALVLPPYREQFAPFIEEYLATRCSGTVEDLEAIARVGTLSVERLVRWGEQHGKAWPVTSERTEPLPSLEHDESRPAVATCQRREYFDWRIDDRVQQLAAAFLARKAAASSVHAACVEIAGQFGWPVKTVEYKVYQLGLPERRREETAIGDDQLAAPEPEKAAVLMSEGNGEEVHEPEVPAPASDVVVPQAPASLESGPQVWTVKGDPQTPQWQLPYRYGTFPDQLVGKDIQYRGALYRVERAYNSQLTVRPLAAAAV